MYVFAYAVKPLILNESDHVRVHFRKDRYLDMLTALEVRLAQMIKTLRYMCCIGYNSGAVYSNRIWLCFCRVCDTVCNILCVCKKGARSVLANFYDCVSLIFILMGLLAYLNADVQKLKF